MDKELKTIELIAGVKGKGLWKSPFQEGAKILQNLLNELNEVWETDIHLTCQEDDAYLMSHGGGVARNGREIILAKISLMTFLHEYYHCLVMQKGLPNTEEAAQRWSHMIFKRSLPNIYDKSARAGRFFHVVAE